MRPETAILAYVQLHSITRSTKRFEDEIAYSLDVSNNGAFLQSTRTLLRNNSIGSLSGSILNIGAVASFVFLYAPYPVQLSVSTGGPATLSTLEGVYVHCGALSALSVKNLNEEADVSVRYLVS